MGTIGVGVGHEDDLAITGLVEVEGLARPGTNDLDDRGALGVLEHGTKISLLHIENLAAYRKQSLVLGVTSHVGRSEGGITLDDEQLGNVRIGRSTVLELGRQVRGFQSILTTLVLLVCPGSHTGPRSINDLLHKGACYWFVSRLGRSEEGSHLVLNNARHKASNRRSTQHLLGLTLKLGLCQAHRHHGRHPLKDVILNDLF